MFRLYSDTHKFAKSSTGELYPILSQYYPHDIPINGFNMLQSQT
jgi:hypothetical protein